MYTCSMTEALAKNLKMLRSAKNLTSQEAAKQCGLSRPVYSRIERGDKSAKLHELTAISKGMRVSISELLGEHREPLKLTPETEQLVDRLDALPLSERIQMLEVLDSIIDKPQGSIEALQSLLQVLPSQES